MLKPELQLADDNSIWAYYDSRSNQIVLSTGLVARFKQSDIDAVIAHEYGHVAMRHGRRQAVVALGLGIWGMASGILITPLAPLLAPIFALWWYLQSEHEADVYARRMGYDLSGVLHDFAGMLSENKQYLAAMLVLTRIKLLEINKDE
jgi:Zn-dependent protease with chaperone function